MKKTTEYLIPIRGLKEGQHEYNYVIDPSFFDTFGEEEIKCEAIDVRIKLNKNINLFEFDFEISGSVVDACDRCLDSFELSISHSAKLFVKYGTDYEEVDDEVLIIPENEGVFDCSSLILEFIKLSIPIKKVHPEGKCNSEMINRIADLDPHKEDKTDPRWDALKGLLNNN